LVFEFSRIAKLTGETKMGALALMLVPTMFVVFGIALLVAMGFWTTRTLTYWLSLFKKRKIVVPFWAGLITALLLNGAAFAINAITEIIRLILK
jgi:hypothetical protein